MYTCPASSEFILNTIDYMLIVYDKEISRGLNKFKELIIWLALQAKKNDPFASYEVMR